MAILIRLDGVHTIWGQAAGALKLCIELTTQIGPPGFVAIRSCRIYSPQCTDADPYGEAPTLKFCRGSLRSPRPILGGLKEFLHATHST
eukprot:1122447-Prymnesium_polylepis.1